jgi:hypothetical protein
MKKIYFSICTVFSALTLNAQQTIGFENVNLSPESFNNGSSGSGGFIENGVVFSNEYFSSGDYATGFSVSNKTDKTTVGYGNQYSAYTGSGYNSSNYGVFTPDGNISFAGQGVDLQSFKITNTTYAALSMRDGDPAGQYSFAKQFGSINNAKGNPDGTNGADYFRVWTIAHREDGSKIDSTVFYLADFRSLDNSKDYILDTWEHVDFTFLKETVYKLSFKFESSDNSVYSGVSYPNTPSYFVIDNLIINKSTGLKESTLSSVSVYPNPIQNELTISGENGLLELVDLTGKILISKEHYNYTILNVSDLNSGSYILKLTSENGTLIQKLVK